jgi:hypothetical protein
MAAEDAREMDGVNTHRSRDLRYFDLFIEARLEIFLGLS